MHFGGPALSSSRGCTRVLGVLDHSVSLVSRRRTLKRTAKLKDELSQIDYEPNDNENAIKGLIYREAKQRFIETAHGST